MKDLNYLNKIRKLVFTVILSLIGLKTYGACPGETCSVPSAYPTIQAAIDAASEGDTISVAPGTYNEAIVLAENSLSLFFSYGYNVLFSYVMRVSFSYSD